MIEILTEIHGSLESQTEAIGILAREQAGAMHAFASELGKLSANVELILGQVRAIGTRLGVTEAELDEIQAARLVSAGKRGNGNGNGDAE